VNNPTNNGRVGEVVEASTTSFLSHCHELYNSPHLGSLVRTGGQEHVYGVVAEVRTQNLDPGRRPIAMGENEETEEAVYERHPQLTRLLSTEFHAVVVGHDDNGTILRHLSPVPPRIHSFVYTCNDDEVRDFSGSLEFLPVLFATPVGPQDEVVASFLHQASRCHDDREGFLIAAGKVMAPLLSGQMQRLNAILGRLAQ